MAEHPTPIAKVDIVLLTVADRTLQVGLLRRAFEPFAAAWASPGGFVHTVEDRDLAGAAVRVLRDKAGLVPRYLDMTLLEARNWEQSSRFSCAAGAPPAVARARPARHLPGTPAMRRR